MKCNETQGKWCKNKHGASKIIDTFETYHRLALASIRPTLAIRSGALPRISIYSPSFGNTLEASPRIGIYSPGVGNTLGGFASHWHLFARCWQHAQRLHLALASIRPVLATRSGASPRIGIFSPGVGNMLGGFASHWHLFDWRWQHGALPHIGIYSPGISNALGGYTLRCKP
jgi:hypothetical protein